MEAPLVTICIPTYNRAHVVGTAIRSALDQTYINTRVVVVDNRSTDGTVSLLARFQREAPDRFRFFVNDSNLGMQGNFGRCLEVAEGTYFKIVCSDDRIHPEMIEKQVAVMETSPHVVAVTARRRRHTDSWLFRWYDPVLRMKAGLWHGPDAVRYVFRVSNMIGGPAQILTRLDAFRGTPGFRHDTVVGNMFDIEPVLHLLASGWDLYVMNEVLCDYNSDTSSYTSATLTDPAVQAYYYDFREEQARDALYARCLHLPADLTASRRNVSLLLLIAGFAAAFPKRDRLRAARLFDFVESRFTSIPVRCLRRILELMLALPGGAPARIGPAPERDLLER